MDSDAHPYIKMRYIRTLQIYVEIIGKPMQPMQP